MPVMVQYSYGLAKQEHGTIDRGLPEHTGIQRNYREFDKIRRFVWRFVSNAAVLCRRG